MIFQQLSKEISHFGFKNIYFNMKTSKSSNNGAKHQFWTVSTKVFFGEF